MNIRKEDSFAVCDLLLRSIPSLLLRLEDFGVTDGFILFCSGVDLSGSNQS